MAIQRATHRLTHSPTFIFASDDAWDSDKIEADRKRITSPEGDPQWLTWDAHPVARYRAGRSRYDVETVRPWLLADKAPTLVRLRRMTFEQWQTWQGLLEGVRPSGQGVNRHLVFAMRHGLERVELAPDHTIESVGGLGLSDDQLEALRREVGDAQFQELAIACAHMQQALTADEAFR